MMNPNNAKKREQWRTRKKPKQARGKKKLAREEKHGTK
jgi:hypothetical protein